MILGIIGSVLGIIGTIYGWFNHQAIKKINNELAANGEHIKQQVNNNKQSAKGSGINQQVNNKQK